MFYFANYSKKEEARKKERKRHFIAEPEMQ
jgi:hypothetical protein